MNDVIHDLNQWRHDSESIAVAVVTQTWGSAPRPVGSRLIVTASGRIAGSVSGGCVEGAVIDAAQEVIETGEPQQLSFGVTDETAWEVGLACGGQISVYVEPFTHYQPVYAMLRDRLGQGALTALVSQHGTQEKALFDVDGWLIGSESLHSDAVLSAVMQAMETDTTQIVASDTGPLFVEVYTPRPRLIIIGAVHIAHALIPLAHHQGFDCILIDPRSAFATVDRFPNVDQLINQYPNRAMPDLPLDRYSYVVVLTHDPKIDDPALLVALPSDAAYIGALGSTKTHQKRVTRLSERGLTQAQIKRLHAPIGLNLGGRSPEEIALSIMAEIVQVRNQLLREEVSP